MKKLFIFALVVLSLASILNAETLDLGGKRVELVNGTITNKDAKIVFTKYHSLYKRGKYYDALKVINKFINYYKGNKLPEAYFLKAKAEYMNGDIEDVYNNFLNLYDTYPDSKIVKRGLLAKTIKKAIKNLGNKFVETLKINKPQYLYLDKILKYNALHHYISGKYVNIDKLLSKHILKKEFVFTKDSLPWKSYHNSEFYCDNCIKIYEKKADTGPFIPMDFDNKKDLWRSIYVNLELSAIASFIDNELDYLGFNPSKRKIYLGYRYWYSCYNISKTIDKDTVLDIPGNYIENITNIFHNIKKDGKGNLVFPKNTYKLLEGYLDRGKIIAYNFNGLKFKIKLVKYNFKGMKLSYSEGGCSGSFEGYPGPKFSVKADKIHLVFKMVEIPNVKDIAIAKHGSLYDWVGLKRVDDAL